MNRFSISKHQIETIPTRTIAIIAYPGIEVIDVVGPVEVFALTNVALQREGLTTEPVYQIEVLGKDDKPISTLSGLQIVPTNCYGKDLGHLDTLIVPGGADPEVAANDTELVDWICTNYKTVRRLASVCNGAAVLAKSGLLDGRRATSHWDYCDGLMQKYPSVKWEPDRIFVCDGSIWSSGGITSGIDLALAMLEEDWGHKLALAIAQYMVVFLKRPGGQSQFSAYLASDAANRPDIRDLQAWIIENPDCDMRVEALAERMDMSPRNFARVFLTETGMTPAKFVERVRIDMARHYLESTEMQVGVVADKAGFKDSETMRRAFVRHVGINPIDYRIRFGHKKGNGSEHDRLESEGKR